MAHMFIIYTSQLQQEFQSASVCVCTAGHVDAVENPHGNTSVRLGRWTPWKIHTATRMHSTVWLKQIIGPYYLSTLQSQQYAIRTANISDMDSVHSTNKREIPYLAANSS